VWAAQSFLGGVAGAVKGVGFGNTSLDNTSFDNTSFGNVSLRTP